MLPILQRLRRYVERHPFLTASLALHLVMLTVLFKIGSYKFDQATLIRDQRLVDVSMHEVWRAEMARHVDAIAAMKKLMEQNIAEQTKVHAPPTDANKAIPQKEAAELPKKLSPQELLKEAKALAESMQAIERKEKATELAKLLKIPEEEALKKVAAEQVSHSPGKAKGAEKDQVTSEIKAYEKIAENVLNRQLKRKEKQQDGTSVDTGNDGSGGGKGGGGATNNDGEVEGDGTAASLGGGGYRSYGGYRPMLSIDATGLRKVAGRVIGADGPYATRIIPDSWYVIGPFPSSGDNSMKIKYPPETLIDLDGVYFGKNHHAVEWRYVQSDQYPIVPPGEPEGAVYYGYTELTFDQDRDMWVALGSDEDSKVWLNDQLVWSSGNADKAWYTRDFRSMKTNLDQWSLTEANRLMHFKKGHNKILFKLYNEYGVLFFSFVIANS